jgi:hypothetical protein
MREAEVLRPDSAGAHPLRTLWHRLLGKHFELLLAPVDILVYSEAQVMSTPPKADILLLRRQTEGWTPAQLRLLPDGIHHSRASHILIEFKFSEAVNGNVFRQAVGYDFFYRQAQALSREEAQIFVMSSRKPRALVLAEYGYRMGDIPGVYESRDPLLQRIPLLVLNELTPAPHNAFVQCFASWRKVRERAFRRLEQLDWESLSEPFWDFFVGLRSYWGIEGVEVEMSAMAQGEGLTPELVLETGKRLRKALLATLTPQEIQAMLAKLTPEERLAGLAPEERLAGLAPEERLAGLAPEERLALLARLEASLRPSN